MKPLLLCLAVVGVICAQEAKPTKAGLTSVLGVPFASSCWSDFKEFGQPVKADEDTKTAKYLVDFTKPGIGKVWATFFVSKKTGKIIEADFPAQFQDVHSALAWAAALCEGRVALPRVYSATHGYQLHLMPGERFFDHWVSASIRVDELTARYSVRAGFAGDPDEPSELMKELTTKENHPALVRAKAWKAAGLGNE